MSDSLLEWSKAWKQPLFRGQFIVTLMVMVSFTIVFRRFLDYAESRQGLFMNDPLLDVIPVHDVTWVVFFFLYSGIVVGLLLCVPVPKLLLLAMQTYVLVTLLRICSITLVPLEPPAGYLPLKDPFVQFFTSGERIISKDLFYSGHVSTISAVYFTVQHRIWKPVLLMFVIMVALLVMIQHVHYTIDVLVAPVMTWLCYRFSRDILLKKIS